MAKQRPKSPVLEAYLKGLKPPSGTFVLPDWWSWVGAIGAFIFVNNLPIPAALWIALLTAGLVYSSLKFIREKLIAQLPLEARHDYDRFRQSRKLAGRMEDGGLHRALPEPVLLALESTATLWHEARQQVLAFPTIEHELREQLLIEIDKAMLNAVVATGPVTRHEDQSAKAFRQVQENEQLCASVIRLISVQSSRLGRYVDDLMLSDGSHGSLSAELSNARVERETAEHELQVFLGSEGELGDSADR